MKATIYIRHTHTHTYIFMYIYTLCAKRLLQGQVLLCFCMCIILEDHKHEFIIMQKPSMVMNPTEQDVIPFPVD